MIKYYLAKGLKRIKLSAIKSSVIDRNARILGGNTILCSEIGAYSYTGYDTQILFTKVGKYCSIGSNCKIGGAGHPLNWVSTSPLFHNGRNIFGKHFAQNEYNPYSEVIIGNDVWIGQEVLIKGGVSIGNGAVIGMGAVVTKNIGPYEIWAGNPARFIRKRFDDETIERLEKMRWWLWDENKVSQYGELFSNVEEFVEKIEEEKI